MAGRGGRPPSAQASVRCRRRRDSGLPVGTGYGAYIAVDQALITQVLPKSRDRAKDLGINNIAIVCPGAIGALIAAPLVSFAGYSALFGATAVVAITAAIGVWKIKSVR